MPEKRSFRCAVYTRKSTDEGLEQDFNSLHAQREACEAYIKASDMRAGAWFPPPTTMADIRGARWSALPLRSC